MNVQLYREFGYGLAAVAYLLLAGRHLRSKGVPLLRLETGIHLDGLLAAVDCAQDLLGRTLGGRSWARQRCEPGSRPSLPLR